MSNMQDWRGRNRKQSVQLRPSFACISILPKSRSPGDLPRKKPSTRATAASVGMPQNRTLNRAVTTASNQTRNTLRRPNTMAARLGKSTKASDAAISGVHTQWKRRHDTRTRPDEITKPPRSNLSFFQEKGVGGPPKTATAHGSGLGDHQVRYGPRGRLNVETAWGRPGRLNTVSPTDAWIPWRQFIPGGSTPGE